VTTVSPTVVVQRAVDTRPTGSSYIGPALRKGAREDHSMTVTDTETPQVTVKE